MGDNKEYMTHQENMGLIQVSEDVVATIATTTALEVDGVGGLMWTSHSAMRITCAKPRTDLQTCSAICP